MRLNIGSAIILSLVFGFLATTIGYSQPRRNIKVVLQIQQTGTSSQENVQGSGSVIIRRGTVSPSGRLTAGDRQTTVQRSSGIFTLVADGGESILTVATRVPQSEVAYFHNYALGIGIGAYAPPDEIEEAWALLYNRFLDRWRRRILFVDPCQWKTL